MAANGQREQEQGTRFFPRRNVQPVEIS
uniref:Uncharacterized protein n=1 Tax=Arundo donax TaxID=35708 RepID=A0A0A8YYG6_ARUDO